MTGDGEEVTARFLPAAAGCIMDDDVDDGSIIHGTIIKIIDGITNKKWNSHFPLFAILIEIIIHSTPHMNGRATTRGVFKAYAFFI